MARRTERPAWAPPDPKRLNRIQVDVAVVRDQLLRLGGRLHLKLDGEARGYWGDLGLTLAQRDAAANVLVAQREARYVPEATGVWIEINSGGGG